VGGSWDYPEANYSSRQRIFEAHKDYTLGLYHFLATDPSLNGTRAQVEAREWGLAADEFVDTGTSAQQMYY
jgi:hypothetical protein